MEGLIPFPTVEEHLNMDIEIPAPANTRNSAHETDITSSSKLTSSDKLSALPIPLHPTERPPKPHYRHWPLQHNYHRHSLDATSSLPSFSMKELETIRHDSKSPSLTQRRHREENASSSGRAWNSGDSSPGKETPKQRVSFDSERAAKVGAFSRLVSGRSSEPSASPHPPLPPRHELSRLPQGGAGGSDPLSLPHSRATSPLRIFHQWSSGMHHRRHRREEPFVPVNPFKMRRRKRKFTLSGILSPPPSPDLESGVNNGGSASASSSGAGVYDCEDVIPVASIKAFFEDVHMLVTDTLPRQLYLNMLLQIPAMYFSRVARIFQDAEVSRPEIQRMIDEMCGDDVKSEGGDKRNGNEELGTQWKPPPPPLRQSPDILAESTNFSSPPQALQLPLPDEWTPTSVSPSLFRFKYSWESFIDSLIREWKTLNVVSALLSSAILSIFQVPEAADDPVTRTLALLSLVSSLMSLSYGCMYIVRFATMRSMFRASRWADEARNTKTNILWNVWVMLAMPAVWISWAMLFFLSAILSFVWRTGSEADPESRLPLSAKAALGPRIVITAVFALGMVYLVLIIRTLKRYGGGHHKGVTPYTTRERGAGVGGFSPGDNSAAAVARANRMSFPFSSKDVAAVNSEQRGRKRHRTQERRHWSKSPRKAELGAEMKEVRKGGGVLKDLESSLNLKDLVRVSLSRDSVGSL